MTEPLIGQALIENDKKFNGEPEQKSERAIFSGYPGDDEGTSTFFKALLKAAMDKAGVSAEVQKQALPENQ